MAKYTTDSFVKNQQMQQSIAQANVAARERLTQMFIDQYMTPGAFADAQHRIGRVLGIKEEKSVVSTWGFPPEGRFNEAQNPPYSIRDIENGDVDLKYIAHENLPARLGGFKTVNDRINDLQLLLREVYGEIRTKITEWDLSIYLQELVMDPDYYVDLAELSVLYRLKEDNPGRYRDSRAYSYGMLNTVVSFERWKRWDPRFDSDLRYWRPPTNSLELWAYPPKPRRRRITYTVRKRKKTRWWGRRRWKTYKRTRWVWYTPKRPRLNRLQRREVHRALAAKWTNWFPAYWRLFFWDPDLNSLGDEDERAIEAKHMQEKERSWRQDSATAGRGGASGGSGSSFSLKRFKRAKKNRSKSNSQAEMSLAASGANGDGRSPGGKSHGGILGKKVRESGLNTKSPIWTGSPVGRYRDPRSLAGYLANERNSWNTPKIAPTTSSSHAINRRNQGLNQMEGLDRVLNGWSTRFRVRRSYYIWVRRWYRTSYSGYWRRRRRLRLRYRYYGYSRWRRYTWYGYYVWRQVKIYYWTWRSVTGQYPYLRGTLRYEKPRYLKETRTRRWFWWRSTYTRRTYVPGQYIIVGAVNWHRDFSNTFIQSDRIPVIFTSQNGDMTSLVTLEKGSYRRSVKYYKKVRRWFRRTRYRKRWKVVNYPCYIVHTRSVSQFASGIGSSSSYVMTPQNLAGYARRRSRRLRGFFFNIPIRSLSDSDNVITSNWGATTNYRGRWLARGFTTCVWRRHHGRVIAQTLPRTISTLHTRLVRVRRYLEELQNVFEGIDSDLMRALVDELPDDRQQVRSVVLARRRYSHKGISHMQRHLSYMLSTLNSLIDLTTYMRSENGLTVGRVRDFIPTYRRVTVLTQNKFFYRMMDSYLDILYEWRTVYLKQRLNKVDGTLLQMGRIESIDIPTQEGTGEPPSMANPVIDEILQVVHKTTNVSLPERAEALNKKEKLPTERIHYVYVPVQYDENSNIIRHKRGYYDLISREYMESRDSANPIRRVRFFITFEGAAAPPIVKNVMTNVNGQELQKIVTSRELSMLEKICAARETQDWWKIEIPVNKRPLTQNFETDNLLMVVPEDTRIQQLMDIIGNLRASPVLENQEGELNQSLASLDDTVAQFHSTAMQSNK